MKKIFSMLLVGALAVGMFPMSTFAQTEGHVAKAQQSVVELAEGQVAETPSTFSVEGDATIEDDWFDELFLQESESNNSIDEANQIETDYMVLGYIDDSNDDDYYRFYLEEENTICMVAASWQESFSCMLLDEFGNVIDVASDLGYDEDAECWNDELVITLEAGEYYLWFRDLNVEEPMDYLFNYMIMTEDEIIPEVYRIFGKDRYATSDKIVYGFMNEWGMEKLDSLIIASGTSFPDALAGSYLANVLYAPILLTDGNLNVEWFEENVYDDAIIYILGGSNAVPTTVEETLNDYNVIRLSGKDRYDTNMAILKEALALGGSADTILVCTGKNFADSLSASATGLPILLVGDKLTAEQKSFIDTFSKSDFYVLGGTAAVNDSIYNTIDTYGDVTRISGETRYETSVKIAEEFFIWPDRTVLAYAKNFPDGLCGGPLAMSMFDTPLILTKTGNESVAKAYAEEYDIHSGYVLGGSKLISDASAKKIFGLTDVEVQTFDTSMYTDIASKGTGTVTPNQGTNSDQTSGSDSGNVIEGIYITPTGSRYHYLKDCAGKNAIKTTLDYATKHGYTGCKTCVY